MTAATKASLREILLDSLEDAYWFQKGEVEDCGHCRNSPAGICGDRDHQEANDRAREYEEAKAAIRSAHFESGLILLRVAAPAAGDGGTE